MTYYNVSQLFYIYIFFHVNLIEVYIINTESLMVTLINNNISNKLISITSSRNPQFFLLTHVHSSCINSKPNERFVCNILHKWCLFVVDILMIKFGYSYMTAVTVIMVLLSTLIRIKSWIPRWSLHDRLCVIWVKYSLMVVAYWLT